MLNIQHLYWKLEIKVLYIRYTPYEGNAIQELYQHDIVYARQV